MDPQNDALSTEIMLKMGYSKAEIHRALSDMSFSEVYATYHLLGTKPTKSVSKIEHCTVYIVHCTLYTVHRTLYIELFSYIIHSIPDFN